MCLTTCLLLILITVFNFSIPASAQWSTSSNVNNAISTIPLHSQLSPTIASDGAGGAIITWWEGNNAGTSDIYAQRISANGVVLWTTNGIPICTDPANQSFPQIISDGAGGAIILWHDTRNRYTWNPFWEIYAQRVNAAGVPQWAANRVFIGTELENQTILGFSPDGQGGALIAWTYPVSVTDIYVQKINPAGVVQWGPNGTAVCTDIYTQLNPAVTSDGSGGAIITWSDYRTVLIMMFTHNE